MMHSNSPGIYNGGYGDALVDERNYPDLIREYLKGEAALIEQLVTPYEVVVEVGCMTGRHTKQILKCGKDYIGVDMVDRYIKAAQKKFCPTNSQKVVFCCTDIHDAEEAFSSTPELISLMRKKVLLIFPFNSFGNIDNIENLAQVLNRLSLDSLVNTYTDTDESCVARQDYYRKSGFQKLRMNKGDEKVQFLSKDGLNTTSYNKKWFDKRFGEVEEFLFGGIGAGFKLSLEKGRLENSHDTTLKQKVSKYMDDPIL